MTRTKNYGAVVWQTRTQNLNAFVTLYTHSILICKFGCNMGEINVSCLMSKIDRPTQILTETHTRLHHRCTHQPTPTSIPPTTSNADIMPVATSQFGRTPAGEDVTLYTLTNGTTTAKVITYGGVSTRWWLRQLSCFLVLFRVSGCQVVVCSI